ncbi:MULTISPECIES: biotin/lipoyl-containing protein [Falsihalocynthiibacter]|uniref:biotin/lipoyl-containing protein n=1 Tax=Falsihalocynthiibacter TaxID=2854182 RepID=UPI0030034BD1
MAHEVIMPALGMAQETGKIVRWQKQAGDSVKIGDVLMEVETDKAVMDVEALADGYLGSVSAAEGDDVPVGQVIALISDSADATSDVLPVASPAIPQTTGPVESQPTAPSLAKTAPPPAPAPLPINGTDAKIFASPKARRLAKEQGLDLERLVALGHPQPYHAADLETLRSLPVTRAPTAQQAAAMPNQITARVATKGTQDFLQWMLAEGNVTLAPSAIWAAFAAAALRTALQAGDDELVISLLDLQAEGRCLTNPDRARLSFLSESDPDAAANLILRDLSASPISSLRLAGWGAPSLSIATEGDTYLICLDFTPYQLSDAQAIQLISEFADRLTDPLRHLL